MSCELVRTAWMDADKELTQAAADADTASTAASDAVTALEAAESRLKTAGATADEAYTRYVRCTMGEPYAGHKPA